MTRAVLSILLLFPLILSERVPAQAPEAQKVPAEAATSISLSRSALMEVPTGQNIRRIASDGAVVTSRWEGGTVTFTLHDPKSGGSAQLPFSPSVSKTEYRSVTEVRVDGPYVSFTDVRDPDFAVYNRNTGEVHRLTHPEGGITFRISVSPETGDVLYERRNAPTTQSRVYLWRKGTDRPVLIEESAMSPRWAPSGNFFLMKKRMLAQGADRGDDGAYLYLWLYNQEGNPLLNLSRYGRATGDIEWSPDSKKIVMDPVFGRTGFYIIYLGGDGQSVEIERTRYISPPEGQSFFDPKWSPDGRKLAYIVEHAGDQSGARMELRFLEDRDGVYQQYSAGARSASTFFSDPWGGWSTTGLTVVGGHEPGTAVPNSDRRLTEILVHF